MSGRIATFAEVSISASIVIHYQRMLDYGVPDYVHIMEGGRIIKTGGNDLALELESRGQSDP